MNFSRYIAFSIVASSVLCGATDYTNWNGGNFQDGDTVNISYQVDPTKPQSKLPLLTSNITLASGTLTANVNIISSDSSCGFVGCFSSQTTFGSTGANLVFNVTGGIFTNNPAAFDITSGGLTVDADIKVSGNIPTSTFRAQNGSSLAFNGNVELSGATTAITMGTGTLKINESGGKKVDITGNITLGGGSTNIKLDSNDDTISGNISATNGTTKLELSNGSKITGTFTGNGNGTLNLTIDGSTYDGSVTNAGTSNVTIKGGGTLQGNLTTSGTSLDLKMGNGTITGSVTSTATTNKLEATDTGNNIIGNLSFTGKTNSWNNTWNQKITINGNASFTANNGGSNTLNIQGGGGVTGTLTTSGDTSIESYSNTQFGKIVHNSGSYTQKLYSHSQVTNGIAVNGSSSVNITAQDSQINGTSSITSTGAVNLTFENNATGGNFTLKGSTNTLTGTGSNTLNSINMTGTTNSLIAKKATQTNGGLTQGNLTITTDVTMNGTNTIKTESGGTLKVNGNATLTATNGQKNDINLENGGITGTLTTSGNTTLEAKNSTSFGSISHSNGTFTANLSDNSTINNGITTASNSDAIDITLNGSSQLNGTSSLGSKTSAKLTMKGTSNGGNITFQSPSNTLEAQGTNNTLTGLTMQGQNGGNATNKLNVTGKLIINGNATLKGTNDIDFKDGGITGTLTTSGNTTLDTQNSTNIAQGFHHSDGNLTAKFTDSSKVDGGITTSGTGNANVTFDKTSQLNGDSNFASTNNTLTLNDNSKITGNTSFSNNSTLTASNGTTITGQIITNSGTANYTFGSNGTGVGTGATVTGGINTEAGATKTTANFTNGSILQNGTSTFNSNIDITFANTSKAISETFNVAQGTANITFKDSAEMQGGSINNNGGTANITFQDNSKINNNGSINTTNGTTKLEAKNNADLTGTITQSGGNFNATFSDSAKFNGDATQTGGDSNINFKDNATWTGSFNQDGATSSSTITFSNTANMTGNITTTDGKTNITFNDGTKITGDIKAQGTENKVTFTSATLQGNLTLDGLGDIFGDSQGDFTSSTITGDVQGYDDVTLNLTGTKVEGYVHQGSSANNSGMTGTFTDSQILGGFAGTDSINKLDVTHSDIQKGVSQSGASLTMTATNTTISGGFSGTNNSTNTVTMTKGSLTGGITQNTGSLDFKSQMTSISGGFTGWDSTNTLKMANGDFNNGKISQVLGSVQGEIIMMSDLGDFGGESSDNVIHLSNSKIKNVVQSSGSLELNTNADVEGKITGDRGSQNKITVTGANVTGEISQSLGSMDLTLLNSNAKDQIKSSGADFGLYATNATVEGDISLINSASNGISDNLTLNGKFTQSNGTSTMTFSNTNFKQETTITNAQSASLIFSRSQIQNITATKGITAYNLSDSTMTSFSGNMGQHAVTLVKSNATTFNQKGGSIILNASNGSTATSVTGTNFANVAVTLDRSNITEDIINGGETTIAMQDSTIGRNVEQTAGSLSFTASNSTLTGHYKQTDGTSMVNFMDSKIQGGIDLTTLDNGTMNFTQNSQISNGVKSEDSRFTFMLLSGSALNGGFTQNQGQVTGAVDESTLNDGMTLSNGSTNFSFYNDSKLNGNIGATNHNTTILIDRSTINGNMTITGGTFDLTAQNNSTINGNGGGTNKSQVNITDADFKLVLDTGSTFNGDITQINNNQTIIVKQGSTLNGNITNTDVTSSISVNNATINGSISQTRGSLALDLSNGGKVTGDISLTDSNTTLSGSGTGNQIGGDFKQTNGTLGGSMTGLTLTGTYSQTGGTSSVSFINSEFKNATTITNATSSSLTFNNSTLKGYTTDGGTDNTLKLLNGSAMNGTLTLKNQAQTTLTMENSTLTGDNDTAITATGNSFLTFNTKDSTITGKIEANTGGLKGTTDNTDIAGDITLTTTTSNVSFTNTSTITGSLTATDGNNTINFDNSSITGSVSQERGIINLDLSNGSGIGRDLTFKNATANLTGSGAGNSIKGNFDSENTTLTGDASGLTLTGTFTQTNGSSDITFRNESNFNGAVSISGTTSSNINFTNQSGINSTVNITNGTNNAISLSDGSFINGDMTLQGTTATISASNNSSITGNLQATGSNTTLSLSGSTFTGTTTQTNGTLNVNASNNSTLTSNMTLSNGSTNITLNSGSNLTGTITANENPLIFNLNDNSSFNSMEAPRDISITNADFTLNASNNSIFGGNLTHTSNNGADHSANLTFNSNSFYSGTMSFDNITLNAKFNQSGIFSDSVKITGKSALFEFDGSTNGGVIQSLEATNTDLTINAKNQSHITINDLQITGNTLNLTATNSSRLTANVTLNDTTTATYTANTNGNLNVNTHIANQASTLSATISGGIMQGAITQDANGNNGFPNGEVTLSNGGRWAITGDTQIKELTLTNTQEQLYSDAIFASVFNSPLSFVDFTLEFEDNGTTSRVGKEMIRKPEPINGQPIPDAGAGQTYVRQLQVNEIKGNNGLFRVYADLGTNLADNILASKASGDHLIQVQYRAATFREIGSDRIVVAKVTDPTTTVSFKGTQSEIGLTKYDTEILKENAQDGQGFEWIIGQATPAGMSYSSKIIASILQGQYRSFMIEVDSLDRRMGDLEFIKRDKGFWIRSYVGSNTKEATDFSTLATDNYYSIWSGFDYNSIGLTVHNYVGVFFNYTGINTESKDYTGKSSNIAFGIYNTFKANSGFYADILAKYIYTMSEFDITNYSLAKNSPKIDNHKFLLNAEIGYSFYYGEKRKSGYIQPQLQVTSGYIHKSDLSVVDVSGETINASIGRNFPVSIRTGVFWGQIFGEKIKSHIKLGTSLVYDVDSGGILNFKDSSTELQFKQGDDFRWVLSAATDFTFSEFFKLYASFDTSFFGNYNTTYSANLGIRFTFGKPNNYVRNVPVVYSPYTPPVSIDDDRRTVPVVKRYTTKDIDQNYAGKPRKVESYIQGNVNPSVQQGSPTYVPTRQSHRDITSEVEF